MPIWVHPTCLCVSCIGRLALWLAGGVTLGAMGAPTQCPGSSVAFTRPRATGFTRARQTDPLHAIKPSTREQRGQVLGGCIESSPAPSRERAVSSQAKRPFTFTSPLTRR